MSTPKNHKPGVLAIGPLSPIKGSGKHAPPLRLDFIPSERVCNASSQEPLKDYAGQLARTEHRQGCNHFRTLKSVGTGC